MTVGPRPLIVRTQRTFRCAPRVVWPLLCDSKMDRSSAILFKLGVPQPLECRLPEGRGGVGSERECVSDQGVVHQRILEWVPDSRLAFRMEWTDLPSARSISSIEDSFDLLPLGAKVRVVRTTRVGVLGRYSVLKRFALIIGLRQVHRYVYRNWEGLVRRPDGATGAPDPRETPVPAAESPRRPPPPGP